jgi:hypothetical protein
MSSDGWRSTPMARNARLVAMSIGGGAALTVLGATAAHAGDADSVGNHSASDQGQTLVVTKDSDPTIAGITGSVGNGGVAASNSGANRAVNEDADSTQTIHTGNAKSAGNDSQSKLNQSAVSSATGGGLTLIDQGARIGNWGGALANTGFNDGGDGLVTGNADAWGNRSWSTIDQSAEVKGEGGGLRILSQAARIANLGFAVANTGANMGDAITTGNASAGGNQAQTGTTQTGILTDDLVGMATAQQVSRTRNRGLGVANSGFNSTTGDDSTNLASVLQNGELTEDDGS